LSFWFQDFFSMEQQKTKITVPAWYAVGSPSVP